ncbi:MAG: hypothetical protein EHM58_02305 [Ignavibacteriae bacterium]|nr:MAG: hypothetical protein EHM58_02305 [Ignavibacteriota bacterium]
MSKSCKDKKPLQRSGLNQTNRVIAALLPGYVHVDERNEADLILFAKKYASYLNYYDKYNNLSGDWEDLMKMDVSVALATLSKIEVRTIYDYQKLLYKKIKSTSTSEEESKKQFKFLFDLIFSMVNLIDEQYRFIPDEFSYKELLNVTIQNKLSESIMTIKTRFYDYIKTTLNLIDESITVIDEDNAPIPVNSFHSSDFESLPEMWKSNQPLEFSFTVPEFPVLKEKIIYIINHNLFNSQVENLFYGISFFVTKAEELFIQTLKDFPKHTPHYTLFLTFIKLFRYSQDHLNTYSKRHLDFYYKDVLRLQNQKPEPDFAHLIFELQKQKNQHLLKKNTLFKGGKDITGKEIFYSLTEDIVINKAKVSKIHSLQIKHDTKDILIASQIADSDDGQGAKIMSADNSWYTFGDTREAGNAEAGFGIASNILYLNEGERIITVSIKFENEINQLLNGVKLDCFKVKLTGKKDWHKVNGLNVKIQSAKTLEFKFILNPGDPPVVPYSEKIHKEKLNVSLPFAKFILNQDDKNAIPYTLICNQKISSVEISVQVNGIKDLMLSNNSGPIDASKPFKPFGDLPDADARFNIGSREAFQKTLNWIEFNFAWKNYKSPALSTNVYYLREQKWKNDFRLSSPKTIFPVSFIPSKINFEKNEALQSTSLDGFIQLQLADNNYSLTTHLQNVVNEINRTTISLNDQNVYKVNLSSIPTAKEIILNDFSINYAATANISLNKADNENNHIYHFTPFGYYQLVPDIQGTESTEKFTLLPDIINSGELFIGLENAASNTVVNILFQVSEGSSNPLKIMENVEWYYLSGHHFWKPFEKQFIIDRTQNFTQSGVVTISLPYDISNQTTAFENNLHWIKAAVKKSTDAVCKMILITAQAAKVELAQDESKHVEFRQVLPSKAISKLLISDSAIKNITQPFDSYGGRTKESDEHFYIRTSERLRHKQRAISIWDYEHIILEKYPDIYKVKCLNHSGFYLKQEEEIFCENLPGHVTIIPIPDLRNKTKVDPLRPCTPIGMLIKIEKYLQSITSPFIKLHVRNPQFEEIQFDFKVKFYDNLDESYYLQLLNIEIEKFLCPWAYDEGNEISFNGKIVKSSILNFVEERPYVNYIACFKMHHIINRNGVNHLEEKRDIEEAIASSSRSVLISYFNEETKTKHIIEPLTNC